MLEDAQLNQLEEVILGKIGQRCPSRTTEETFLAKTFKYYDLTNTGCLNFEQFKRAFLPTVAGVLDQDLQRIFNRYSKQGVLPYKQFAMEFVSGIRRAAVNEAENADGQAEAIENPEETLFRMKDFLFQNGPRGITSLESAFRDADPQNTRLLHFGAFRKVLADFFQSTPCEVPEEHYEPIFDLFRQPNVPMQMCYDEFFLALKEEPGQERRAPIRQAFRRLDPSSEGLVDINTILRAFNANRHPEVSAGVRTAEEVLNEFSDSLKDHISYRRGQRSYPTNLIAWEEFEDYYKTISGCYLKDDEFCSILQKVWDLDKLPNASVDLRSTLARAAAGAPEKLRAGLHHWQTNTLPVNATHHKVERCTKADDVLLRIRQAIARRGLHAAVEVVQNFYEADDDVDDEIDVYEFRKACQKSNISLKHAEEVSIFEACSSTSREKIRVPKFLRLLHGELSTARREVVERAFGILGGDPQDSESRVSPAALKENFDAQAHPLVVRGQLEPGPVLAEFLDTFSLLAHVLGGCENGLIAFSDFLAYYEVVSSTVENDTLFDLILNRVWSLPTPASPRGVKEAWGLPASPRRSGRPQAETREESPMAERRPPKFTGPSAYCHQEAQAASFRRFGRGDATGPTCSPITKSSIVFNETGHNALSSVVTRLRQSLALRGLKGYKAFVQKLESYDNKRNGSIMRLDWQRTIKALGLGLAPEEQDIVYKALSSGRRDFSMDYAELLRLVKGYSLPEDRAAAVEYLWQALQENEKVSADALKRSFDASSSPQCLLRVPRRDPHQAEAEFFDVVDFFAQGGSFDAHQFEDFFAIVSAMHEDEDEFRLLTSRAFGLQ